MEKNVEKKTNSGALATINFEADADHALKLRQEDVALPFLKLLGQLSPEVNKRDGKYVEGAQPGMILNTVTQELFDGEKGIEELPVINQTQYLEWQDRGESQGAPVKVYEAGDDLPSSTRDKFNKDRLANGNYLEKTGNMYVVVLGKSPSTALLPMKSTQLKVYRTWNSMIDGLKMKGKTGNVYTPAPYSHIYRLKTVPMSNDKGSWYGWSVSRKGPIEDVASYNIAKNFRNNLEKGLVKTRTPDVESKSDSPY